jgi:hypothetical protein
MKVVITNCQIFNGGDAATLSAITDLLRTTLGPALEDFIVHLQGFRQRLFQLVIRERDSALFVGNLPAEAIDRPIVQKPATHPDTPAR